MAPLLAKDYVKIKIDTDRDKNGAEVAQRLRKGESGGIPWMTILDSSGKEIVNADGPQGNVGCPIAPHEREWFMEMIRKSAMNMSLADIGAISNALTAYAKKLGR